MEKAGKEWKGRPVLAADEQEALDEAIFTTFLDASEDNFIHLLEVIIIYTPENAMPVLKLDCCNMLEAFLAERQRGCCLCIGLKVR